MVVGVIWAFSVAPPEKEIPTTVIQGLGYGLMERIVVEDGRVQTTHFGDYKIPTAKDIPELRTALVKADGGVGPYKTKGIGENPISPVAAAIANAVEDALGARIRDLPVTAEKIHEALKKNSSQNFIGPIIESVHPT